ncbi:MAG: PqqD family peptide modification chaperone [Verrucomicrobiaceae bacterium]
MLDKIDSERAFLLWIDSDEEVLCCPSEPPADDASLIFDVKMSIKRGLTSSKRASLHRNDHDVRWVGTIHERLGRVSGLPVPPIRAFPGLAILHHGYDDEDLMLRKLLRNAAIADAALARDDDYPGAATSVAHKRVALGEGSAHDWLGVYKSSEQYARKHGYPLDNRCEAASALAFCGYTRPAEHMSVQNPLNLQIQLSLLVAHHARTGGAEPERFEFVLTCLQRILWDDRFLFDLTLINASRQGLADYIAKESSRLGWSVGRKPSQERNAAMAEQKTFIQTRGILLETFEDDTLLLSPLTNQVVSLNATGRVFWDALASGASIEDCAEMLTEATGEPLTDAALSQLRSFFRELVDSGMIFEEEA